MSSVKYWGRRLERGKGEGVRRLEKGCPLLISAGVRRLERGKGEGVRRLEKGYIPLLSAGVRRLERKR